MLTQARSEQIAQLLAGLPRQAWSVHTKGAEVWITDRDGRDVCDMASGPSATGTATWIAESVPIVRDLVDALDAALARADALEAELAGSRGALALQQTAHDREVERLEAELAEARERASRSTERAERLDVELGHAQIRHAAVVDGRAERAHEAQEATLPTARRPPAPARPTPSSPGPADARQLQTPARPTVQAQAPGCTSGAVLEATPTWWRCRDGTVWDSETQARRWHTVALAKPYLAPVRELKRPDAVDLALPKGRAVYGRFVTRVKVWPPRDAYEAPAEAP